MTVRFPNGQAVQYNDANFLLRTENGWQLFTKENGKWLASIQTSAGVIVEAIPPCYVGNPLDRYQDGLKYKIESLEKQIKTLRKELKK